VVQKNQADQHLTRHLHHVVTADTRAQKLVVVYSCAYATLDAPRDVLDGVYELTRKLTLLVVSVYELDHFWRRSAKYRGPIGGVLHNFDHEAVCP